MTNAPISLRTLADPTRRSLVELLRHGPLTVGELVARTPVTQSAVSQHLQVLKAAHLVKERRVGVRRYYRLDPAALGELRTYFEALWNDAMNAVANDAT